ncbi:MAG TPA: hypothetical protein VGI74_01180 [Streptosporangiaceae bacterium]
MATWAWIVIMVAVLAVVAVAAAVITRQRRTAGLRDRFGAEYDRTVESAEDRRAAETELRSREKQRAGLDIRPLTEASRARYAVQWRTIQERFVDEPAEAASSADVLVHSVMAECGYPIGDFSAQSDLVSVDYPDVAENYRVAHAICERASSGPASTEDLREVLLRYRSLFSELLGTEATATKAIGTASASTAPASTAPTSTVPADAAATDPDTGAQSVPAHQGAGHGPADRETGDDSH